MCVCLQSSVVQNWHLQKKKTHLSYVFRVAENPESIFHYQLRVSPNLKNVSGFLRFLRNTSLIEIILNTYTIQKMFQQDIEMVNTPYQRRWD